MKAGLGLFGTNFGPGAFLKGRSLTTKKLRDPRQTKSMTDLHETSRRPKKVLTPAGAEGAAPDELDNF